MTRDEALYKVKGYLTDIIPVENYSEVEEIIRALKQESCNGLISRKAVIEKGCDSCRFDNRYGEESICSSCARHYSDCYAPQEEGGV